MIWTDGYGRAWQIDAGPEAITLRSGEAMLHLDRAAWERDVQIYPVEQNVVVRFYGQDQEAGFLLGAEQVGEFLSRIGLALPEGTAVTAAPRFAPQVEGPIWPKMTHSTVWALICSALAFLPLIGLLFGLVAIILIVVFRLRSRKTPALAHARTMGNAALVLALGGMAVSLLAAYSFTQTASENLDTLSERMLAERMRYSYGAIAAAILVVVLSLSIHECGHAISAWWCGDDYARSLGRVTLNPFAHMDLFGTVVLPLLLALARAPVFGYAKPVPVRLGGIRRYRRAHILISLAGPGANLLLGATALALYLALGCLLARWAPNAEIDGFSSWASPVVITGIPGGQVLAAGALVLKLTFMINVLLACFNLVPVPPLDGSWVLEHLFPRTLGRFYALIRPYGFLVFLLLLWTNGFDYLLVPVSWPLGLGYGLVAACTGL
ncbi:MAG: site-2 protease family protein [Planctomycetota bacterium]